MHSDDPGTVRTEHFGGAAGSPADGEASPGSSTAPALLLAASLHRSGSTLLQRYITAATETFMWGEAGRLVQGMREVLESWPSRAHDERAHQRAMDDPSVVERTFLPNLSPPVEHLLEGLRAAFGAIYRDLPPGFTRWGWKDVGYGREEVELVRRLFPGIRVILLVRNPWHVARSIRRKGWIDRRGYFRDMAEVATLWSERSRAYRKLADLGDPDVHLVLYERLDQDLDDLNRFLAIDDPRTWDGISRRTLGAAPTLSRYPLTDRDVDTVTDIAGEVAARFGYRPPSANDV